MKPIFSLEVVPKDPLWKLSMAGMLIERHGFDGLWVSDHFFNRNYLVTLASLAFHTKKILLGPAVVNPYTVHPALMAQQAATLWELAPRRVRFAIGAGDASSLKLLGYGRVKPLETVKQAVQNMKKFLTMLDTYKIEDFAVYVGAQGPRMLKVAAECADGVLVNWSNMEMLKESLRVLAVSDGKGFIKAAYVITSINDDEDKAWKTAVPYAAYLMVGASQEYLERLGVEEEHKRMVEDVLRRRSWDELYGLARRGWVDYFSLWGKPSKLRDFVEELIEAGYDEVVFAGPLGPRYLKALKNIASITRSVKRRR